MIATLDKHIERKPATAGFLCTIAVGKTVFDVDVWEPGRPVLVDTHLACDTETEKIIKGAPLKPVLAQFCSFKQKRVQVVHWYHFPEYFEQFYMLNASSRFMMHNAPFDMRVLGMERGNDSFWHSVVGNDKLIDVQLRYFLHMLAAGQFTPSTSLESAAMSLLGIKLSKDESLRLTFKQDVDPSYDQVVYAALDAAVTACLIFQRMPKPYATEQLQNRASIVLNDMSWNGVLVDLAKRKELRDSLTEKSNDMLWKMKLFGYMPRVKGNKSALEGFFKWIEGKAGVLLPRSEKTKSINTGKDSRYVLEAAGVKHPFVEAHKSYSAYAKVLSTYLKPDPVLEAPPPPPPAAVALPETDEDEQPAPARPIEAFLPGFAPEEQPGYIKPEDKLTYDLFGNLMCEYADGDVFAVRDEEESEAEFASESFVALEDENKRQIGVDGRVHAYFVPLVRTGRTASCRPNLQNLPSKGGVRGQFIAAPGHVFYQADYSQLELCALAQKCWTMYGFSTMRDLINQGVDLHTWLGLEKLKPMVEAKLSDKDWRQAAKACNFGLPGGLGVATFVEYMAKQYGVKVPVEQCKAMMDAWKEAYPEMKKHLAPRQDTQFSSAEMKAYIGETIHGRIRRNASYCSACNYGFQGLAADGAKEALWRIYKDGYKIVLFIHDELFVELPDDGNLQGHIKRINEHLILGMRAKIPDVRIKVEGSVQDRWNKSADAIFKENGDMVLWTPELGALLDDKSSNFDPVFAAEQKAFKKKFEMSSDLFSASA